MRRPVGLVRARDDGSLEVVSPRLLRTGETMGELGLTGGELLEVTAAVRQHIDSVTEIFARIYRDYVWEPFDRAGRPSDGWTEIRTVLERLRPLALDTVVATFKLSMDSTVARVLGEEIVNLLNSGQPDPAQRAE